MKSEKSKLPAIRDVGVLFAKGDLDFSLFTLHFSLFTPNS